MVEVVCVWKHEFYVLKGKEKIAKQTTKTKQITGMTKREKAG